MQPFNKLTPGEAERLAWLAEECSEVIQIAMKILRHGYDSYHPDNPYKINRRLLEEEIVDVQRAIHLMLDREDVDNDLMLELADKPKTYKYMHHQE